MFYRSSLCQSQDTEIISRSLSRLLRTLRISSPARRSPIIHRAQNADHSDTSCLLTELPIEIFLSIVDILEEEWRALLSLTCKEIRRTVCAHFDISMRDRSVRIRFLQHLDLDLPEYLTCRSCDSLYQWRRLSIIGYRCMHWSAHPKGSAPGVHDILLSTNSKTMVTMLPEIVDLISRARQRGPQYGLPISFLNGDGVCYHSDMCLTVKACWAQNQIVVSTRRDLETLPGENMSNATFSMSGWICKHGWPDRLSRTWSFWEEKIYRADTVGEPIELKCPYCLTDAEIRISSASNGHRIIALRTWQNFGSGIVRSRGAEQSFNPWQEQLVRLDEASVDNRNVRALFESGSVDSPGGRGDYRI